MVLLMGLYLLVLRVFSCVLELIILPVRAHESEALTQIPPDSDRFRQVELDHARLAMIAVLMSGAVGAGAGAGAGVYMNAHDGFSAVR